MEITDTKIEGDSTNRGPMIDQTYCKFKTVRLVNSHFVSSSKAILETIATWLGKEIKVLDSKKVSVPIVVLLSIKLISKKSFFY